MHRSVSRFTVAILFTALSVARSAAQQEDFTIVVLPDTQYYSARYPAIFSSQTRWIADHRTALNIQFVIGEGDIVDDAESTAQWDAADSAVSVLDAAHVPYALAIGNHDYDEEKPSARSAIAFNSRFGPRRYQKYGWYQSGYPSGSNENFYTLFTVGATDYLVLALEMHARDATLEWATSVLNAHPDHKVILVTHSYMFRDNTRVDACDANDLSPSKGNNGESLWDHFISKNANIIAVLSGHITGEAFARRSDVGESGNVVNQILANYQSWPEGGGGYLRILRFRPSSNKLEVSTYSPWKDLALTDENQQFTLDLASTGQLQETSGTISGKVRATPPSCAAISGADVEAGGTSTTADASGNFSVALPAPATYDVRASAAHWSTATDHRAVHPGFATQLDFFLVATPPSPPPSCAMKTQDPSVTICSPANGSTVTSPVHITAAPTSSSPVNYMEVWVDGVKLYQVGAAALDTDIALVDGLHRLVVRARNLAGVTFQDAYSINVGNQPASACPLKSQDKSVTICAPQNGSLVASPVRIVAGATSSVIVKYLQIYIDGVKQYQVSGSRLDTSLPMPAGTHRLVVLAKDVSEATFKEVYSITVK